MSIELSHIILHQLNAREEGDLQLQLRSTPLNNDANSTQLMEQMHQQFVQKAGKGYGDFREESEVNA